jgi:hypothetical protein
MCGEGEAPASSKVDLPEPEGPIMAVIRSGTA